MRWSLQVPGSLSSPFTRTYFGFADCLGTNDHLRPRGKPAPPRPRRLLAFISLIIHSRPLGQTLLRGLVAAQLNVLVDIRRAHAEALRDNLHFIGMRDQSSILYAPVCFGFVFGENLRHIVWRQLVVKGVVDLNRRRPATGPDALDLFQRKCPIRRNALVPHVQFFLKTLKEFVCSAQHAT